MKKIIFFLFFISSFAEATPYYRFWRGHKKPEISNSLFQSGLNSQVIPKTIRLGSGNGMIGYLPAIPSSNGPKGTPEEVALIIYKSKAHYKKYLSSEEGKKLGEVQNNYYRKGLSNSKAPQRFLGKVKIGKAYELLQSSHNWSQGHSVLTTRVKRRNSETSEYLKSIEALLSGSRNYKKRGLQQMIILVSDELTYAYTLWDSKKSYNRLKKTQGYVNLIAKIQSDLALVDEVSLNKNKGHISPGQGLNLKF
ncbi:MAG: hypothetical protein ACJAT2_001903 [Bacteriovoracaceae bacterium]|jgi:hypothetical protein